MESLALVGALGCAWGTGAVVGGRRLPAAPSVLVAVLVGWVATGVVVSWGLLASLGIGGSSLLAGVAGLLVAWSGHRRAGSPLPLLRRAGAEVADAPVVWAVAAVLCVAQVVLTSLLLTTVGDPGWDAAFYHLPIVGSMVQEGSLFGWPSLRPWNYYPALVEVQGALLGSLADSLRAPSFVQLGYWVWVVLFTASVVAGRVRSSVGVATVVTVAAVPTMWAQARSLYVDVAFGTVFACAAVVLVAAWRTGSRAQLLVAAGLTGALFGMKLGALAAVPLALGVALLALVVQRRGPATVALVVLLGVAGGTPWLLRNAVEWSNPTYPVDLTLPRDPVDGFPGEPPYSLPGIEWYVDTIQRPPFLEGEGFLRAGVEQYAVSATTEFAAAIGVGEHRFDSHNTRAGGFGVAWLLLVLGGAVSGVVALWREGRSVLAEPGAPALLGLLALGVVGALATQSAWWPRFTLGAGIVLAIGAAPLLDRSRWGPALATVVVLAGAVQLVDTELRSGITHQVGCEGGGCVDPEDVELVSSLGLSGFTLDYAPLAAAGPESVALFGSPTTTRTRPYFPSGLWAPDLTAHVVNVFPDDAPGEGTCHDAYLGDAADLETLLAWTRDADPAGRFELVEWEDQIAERVFLLRRSPCPEPAA